jgi:ubiquitin-like protein ATG12
MSAAAAPIPDEDHGVHLPMTMSASVVLTALPTDAKEALEREVERLDGGKGMDVFLIHVLLSC